MAFRTTRRVRRGRLARPALWLTALGLACTWTVVRAGDGSTDPPRHYRATLIPAERTPLATQVDGVVLRYRVKPGDLVNAGDVLVELDSSDATFERDLARQQLLAATSERERAVVELAALETMLDSESVRRIEVDRARSKLEVATTHEREAEIRLHRTEWRLRAHEVRAVRDGVFVARRKLAGQGVRAFETICEVMQQDRLLAVVQVPLDELGDLAVGDAAEFRAPDGTAVPCDCASIGTEVNPGANAVKVEFELDNESLRLRPGTPGEVVYGTLR
ncbi:MAG: efflux RND transporter periplasmic adaptor subunit [Planctomycetes bacterium]|nr:efflux RND transporter periplasmic adaptor subunit [Planctomycetota bacterium]